MGNLFTCEPLDGNGYVLLGFFITMTVMFTIIGFILHYCFHIADTIKVKSTPFILTVVTIYLLFQSLLLNSYLHPCGGNLITLLVLIIHATIFYFILTKKWQITDEEVYTQV